MDEEKFKERILEKVPDVFEATVTDVSGGCGQSFQVLIVSDIFKGLITIKRHRLINDYLKDEIKDLHAFSQKTLTRDEYENAK